MSAEETIEGDLRLYGTAYEVDGVRTHPSRVRIHFSQAEPPAAVNEAMVERAASRFMEVRGLGMHRPWESMTEETRADYRAAFRAALSAALAPQPTG